MRDDDATYRRTMETRLSFWGGVVFRILLATAGIYVLWRVRSVISVLLTSIVIACAVHAMVEPLCRRRWPFVRPHSQRVIATSIVFVLLLLAIGVASKLFLSPFQIEFHKLINNWPVYQQQLEDTFARARDWYAALPIDVRSFLGQQQDHFSVPSPSGMFADIGKKTMTWASHAVEFFLVPVLAFYFTLDGRVLRNQFLFLVPRQRRRQTIAILDESYSIMRAYILSQFWLAMIAGICVTIGLRIIGMDYALILGLFAAITRAIPVIGPFIGGIPLVLLTFAYGAQTGNPYLWVVVTLVFGLMHVIETKLVMPQFLGQALKLHAVVIIIALLIGGEFFGLMGMFLAAPVAALLRVLLMHYFILPNRKDTAGKPLPAQTGDGRILRLERAVRAANAIPASIATTPVSLTATFSTSENSPPHRD